MPCNCISSSNNSGTMLSCNTNQPQHKARHKQINNQQQNKKHLDVLGALLLHQHLATSPGFKQQH
uniref:Uncharacterized protein n=1 Tax=Arundo donax TaxID=35708 RepID=A0A0A8ZR31_ARUDO